VNSSFYNPEFPRKLILRSSTILIKDYIREIDSREENQIFQKAINDYIEILDSFLVKKGKKTNADKNETKNPATNIIDNFEETKKINKKFQKNEKSDENSEMKSIKSINQKIKDMKTPKKFDLHFIEQKSSAKQAETNEPPNSQEEINISNYNKSESSEPAPKFIKDRKIEKKIFGDNTKNYTEKSLNNPQPESNYKINDVLTDKKAENSGISSHHIDFIEEKINEDSNDVNVSIDNYEILKSENFMDLQKICRKINVFFEILEDNKIDKKIKKLLSFIYPKDDNKNFVVCCKQKNIYLLKETLKKRNIDFLLFNSGKIFL